MNADLLHSLMKCETDLDGVMSRFSGNEALYIKCLVGFLDDQTMAELERAIDTESWDEAFTAVHALKGLAGNMGFVPLFHATAELVVRIRAGRICDVPGAMEELRRTYNAITKAIRENCSDTAIELKGETV